MKMLFTAIALAFALPAAAQTAPANPHAGHTQQNPPTATCTPEHAAMGHCTLKPAAPADTPKKGGCCDKDADGKMACCEKAKAAGKKMECCEKGGDAAGAHTGHNG